MTTLLLLPEIFSADAATVEGDAHHHLFRVKRLQVGDELRVVDGRGAARSARIASIGRREARLELGGPAPSLEPALQVELFVAAPKPERAAWLLEKATELGVLAIHFISSDREARALLPAQIERLRRIAISALEQCGRSRLPAVGAGGALPDAVARAGERGARIIVLDGGGARVRPDTTTGRPLALFVGPEGGWSSAENVLFRERADLCWSLGPTVLRVETAAVVAAGIVLAG
jgi:16S rRNA (uracil1498-N3)-methyltransferase